MKDIRNEHEETARLYAEEKMPMNWDRQDPESIGVFYQYYIQRLKELWTPSPPPEGNTPASEGRKSKEEILKAHYEAHVKKHPGTNWMSWEDACADHSMDVSFAAMEEYASQSPPSLQEREKEDELWKAMVTEFNEMGLLEVWPSEDSISWLKSRFTITRKPESQDTAKQSK